MADADEGESSPDPSPEIATGPEVEIGPESEIEIGEGVEIGDDVLIESELDSTDPSADERPAETTEPPTTGSHPPPTSSPLDRALAAVGRTLVTTGRVVGSQVSRAYHSVDPDLRRHIAQLPLLGYSLFGSNRQPVEAGEPDGHAPLLFVHGLGGSRGDFMLMAGYLHLHGRRRSYRIHFAAEQSIDDRARALAEFVAEVVSVTGEPRVDVVAHSLGGLVVRLALHDHDLVRHTRLVITLGTPHAGTYPARYADTPTTRALRRDSPLVRRLAVAGWPEEVHGVSFWSRSDMVVLPPESAALDGTEAVEVTPFSHYSYLIDPRSWALVREQLERFGETGRS